MRSTGARKVTWTTPGWRPISIAPEIVARLATSGTLISSSSAARARPLSVAELRSGPARQRQRLLALLRRQRPGEERQILGDREQERAVDAQALDRLHLERHGAGHVRRVSRDLAVALQRVH